MADPERPSLRRLAARCGILDRYRRADTHEEAWTGDETRERLLSAMGVDASTEAAARSALDAFEAQERDELVAPFQLVRAGEAVRITLGGAARTTPCGYSMRLTTDSGARAEARGECTPVDGGFAIVDGALAALAPGYHDIALEVHVGDAIQRAQQCVAVVPQRCTPIAQRLGRARGAGVCANLYSVAGTRDWGFGDFGVLRELCAAVKMAGGDFVGLNPLHTRNDGDRNPSPYLPSSRLFLDPLYIDISAVPEMLECEPARRVLAAAVTRIASLRAGPDIDYAAVSAAKHELLGLLHAAFCRRLQSRDDERTRAYRAFVEREGDALDRFAVHRVLEEEMAASGHGRDWRGWPAGYARPDANAVAAFAQQYADRIAYQRWIQFEAERQLAAVAEDATAATALGIYQDLAVGSAADGADAWAYQEDLAVGATMGAPPDAFAEAGQEWGVVPMSPVCMRRSGFGYWRRVLARVMRNTGALRIDHVMGLERQYWVPQGTSPTAGAYVAYPAEELFGILALESRRRGVVVIGEDLGTVPDGFRERLVERGLLRSQVLYFERRDDGAFRRPHEYATDALVTANTHDLATLVGFWSGDDLVARRAAGNIADDDALASHRAEREHARAELDALIGELTPIAERDASALCTAIALVLAATPSALVGISLDDIAGELESANIPGTQPPARHNWTRRMHATLAELIESGELARAMQAATRN